MGWPTACALGNVRSRTIDGRANWWEDDLVKGWFSAGMGTKLPTMNSTTFFSELLTANARGVFIARSPPTLQQLGFSFRVALSAAPCCAYPR